MAPRKSAVVKKITRNHSSKIPAKKEQSKKKVVKKQVNKISKAKTVIKQNGSPSKPQASPKTVMDIKPAKVKTNNKKTLGVISPKTQKNVLKSFGTLSDLACSGAFEILKRVGIVTIKVINERPKYHTIRKPLKYGMSGVGRQTLVRLADEVSSIQLKKDLPAKIIIERHQKNDSSDNGDVTQFQVNLAKLKDKGQVQNGTETVKKKRTRKPKTVINNVDASVVKEEVVPNKMIAEVVPQTIISEIVPQAGTMTEIAKKTRSGRKRAITENSINEIPQVSDNDKTPMSPPSSNKVSTKGRDLPELNTSEAESNVSIPTTAPKTRKGRPKKIKKVNENTKDPSTSNQEQKEPTNASRTNSIETLESFSSRTTTNSMIVCLDGKLPTVPIVDCKKNFQAKRKPSSTSETSTTSKSSQLSKDVKNSKTRNAKSKVEQKFKLLGNLNSAMSMLDLEFLNWVGDLVGTDPKHTVIEESTYLALKDELTSTKMCQNICSLSNATVSEPSAKNSPQPDVPTESLETNSAENGMEHSHQKDVGAECSNHVEKRTDYSKHKDRCSDDKEKEVKNPKSKGKAVKCSKRKEKESNDTNHKEIESITPPNTKKVTKSVGPSPKYFMSPNDVAIERRNSSEIFSDDDDAISLYAGSLAFEKSRSNSPNISDENTIAEYESMHENNSNKTSQSELEVTEKMEPLAPQIVVQPKPIEKRREINFSEELQNYNQSMNFTEMIKKMPPTILVPTKTDPFDPSPTNGSISWEVVEPTEPSRSITFKGPCFFYQARICKNIHCRFPHIIPPDSLIKLKLPKLSELHFIKEYLLLRKFPRLMKRYFLYFVEECQKRKLTSLLIKMALDSDDEDLSSVRMLVMEEVLLCLNDENLEDYAEKLLSPFQAHQLCDELMVTIAFTQNFTRFKSVFVKLTEFVVSVDRTFKLDVATNIFERICILPYEENVSKALILILKNTEPLIFKNSFMSKFESLLSERHQKQYIDLMDYKNRMILSSNEGSVNSDESQSQCTSQNGVKQENAAQSNPGFSFGQQCNQIETPRITRMVDVGKPTRTYIVGTPSSSAQANYDTTPSCDGGEEVRRSIMRPNMRRGGWRTGNQMPPPLMSLTPMNSIRFQHPHFRARGGHNMLSKWPRSTYY